MAGRARGHAEQVSQGVLTTVSGTSDAAAPFRLARHVTAGNVAPERSTARRLNSLPLIGAEPIARAASAFARRRSTSILGDVLERVVVDVGSSEFDTKPGAPTLRPTAVFLVAVSGAEHLLPFAGPAVVVAVHPPLIRTVATRDAVGMIAPQRRAVGYGPHPVPDARGDDSELAGDTLRLPDSHTTPSPSPSRMNGYAGWSRVTGAIPCARASAQLTRPFRLSSHAAIASGTLAAAAAGTSPRANVINSVEVHPASIWSSASASRRSMVSP